MRIIVSNLLGLIANIIGLNFARQTDKNKICFWNIVMSVICGCAMLIVKAYTGVITVVCNIIRGILVWNNRLNLQILIILLMILYIIAIKTCNRPLDLIAPVASTLNSLGYLLLQRGKNGTRRVFALIASVLWTMYYLIIFNVVSAVFEISYFVIGLTKLKMEFRIQRGEVNDKS